MTTFIIILLAAVCWFMVSYLGGRVAARAIGGAMGHRPNADAKALAREMEEMDEEIRQARKAAGLPPIN